MLLVRICLSSEKFGTKGVTMRLQELKGVGDKTAQQFSKLNIYSVEDLIKYYPRRYDKYSAPVLINSITESGKYAVECIVKNSPRLFKSQSGKDMLTTMLCDRESTLIKAVWFNMPFVKHQLIPGNRYVFYGEVKKEGNIFTITQPIITTIYDYENLMKSLQPIYALKNGVTNKMISKAQKNALVCSELIKDKLSDIIKERYSLLDYKSAIRNIHFPEDEKTLIKARNRLVFDEFYEFLIKLKELKENRVYQMNECVIPFHEKTKVFIEKLPYRLTDAQNKVLNEIVSDMSGSYVMNRLVQGDVGSGKTIVATVAMMNAAFSGYQSALMVPTEVLANQHYSSISGMFKEYGIDIEVVLLTGSVSSAKKRVIKENIKSGAAQIIIGTHAIIQDNVEYNNLALVITDEQHRFGVRQRDSLEQKGTNPHVMVMSATPIPRTLAIIIYGDLDISIIDTMPSNRIPIKTCVIEQNKYNQAYSFIKKQLELNHQAYVICPMVDENEDIDAQNVVEYTSILRNQFGNNTVIEYLHGKMKADKKAEIMNRFEKGEIHILVSTTVIEVGINVPNATVIMIEDAQRFGLAQLHQLRGRVGRGEYESYCILINSNKNEATTERLNVLYKSNDGFYIANEDLKTRGPGDLFGVRQSGEMLFSLGDIYSDINILKMAQEAALES